MSGDDVTFLAAQRWLSGDIQDRQLSRVLPVSSVPAAQQNLFALNALYLCFN